MLLPRWLICSPDLMNFGGSTPNTGCLVAFSVTNSLPSRVKEGHNPTEKTALCSDRSMPMCYVFLMLIIMAIFLMASLVVLHLVLKTSHRQEEAMRYPPPSQPVRLSIWSEQLLIYILMLPLILWVNEHASVLTQIWGCSGNMHLVPKARQHCWAQQHRHGLCVRQGCGEQGDSYSQPHSFLNSKHLALKL